MADVQTLEAIAAAAVQFNGKNHTTVAAILPDHAFVDQTQGAASIRVPDRRMRCDPGEWVVALTDGAGNTDIVVLSNAVYVTYFEDA